MAVSIDYATLIISVPKADMLLVQSSPTEIRELDLDAFRLELKALEDNEEGMPFLDTHNHVGPITVGGVTLARIIEIINGYTVTFEDGQYAVNLVGANSNVADVTNVNQVSVRSANSAGLTYSKEIEDQSFFDARVWIDTATGAAGTQYPLGTPGEPVDSHTYAKQIIDGRGLAHRIFFRGAETITSNISESDWLGSSADVSSLTFGGGINTNNCVFRELSLTGTQTGYVSADHCEVYDLTDVMGHFIDCGIRGTLTCPSGMAMDRLIFSNCHSIVAGVSTPILDMNGCTSMDVSIRDYSGGIEIRNFSDMNSSMTIDMNSGHVVLDSTCTSGTIIVRGAGHLTDNSAGTTVVKTGLVYTENIEDLMEADEEFTLTTAVKRHKDTKDVLLSKNVTGPSAPFTNITIDE